MNHKTLLLGSTVNAGIALVLMIMPGHDKSAVMTLGGIAVLLMWMAAAARRGQ